MHSLNLHFRSSPILREAFLGYDANQTDTEGKFMVVNRDELGCAWLVRSIYGLRYFDEDEDECGTADFDARVRPYVTRAFSRGCGSSGTHGQAPAKPSRKLEQLLGF